jgi:hypothetical protein
MKEVNFVPILNGVDPVTVHEDPYFRADIEAKDVTGIYYCPATNCTRDPSTMSQSGYDGFPIFGFNSYDSGSSGSISKDLYLDKTGDYRIFVRVVKAIKQDGQLPPQLRLELDDKLVDVKSVETPAYHFAWLDFGRHRLNAGTHNLEASFYERDVWFESFIVLRVNLLSTEDSSISTSLDAQSVEYTKNTIAEMNTAKLDVIFKDDFLCPENLYSRMVFDFMDPVTFFVGEDREHAKPDFGGYFLGYTLNEDTDVLKMNLVGREADFYRSPTFKNFAIGYGTSGLDQSVNAHRYNFSNLMQFMEYIATGIEFPLFFRHKATYAFLKDMGNVNDFNSVITSGFLKKHDKSVGMPPPGLMLYYENKSLAHCSENDSFDCEKIIWGNASEPINAAENPYLVFDYMAKGASTIYPVKFNIVVTMYRTGENYTDAKDYTITVNSSRVEGQVIGHADLLLSGLPESFKFNLKDAFDKYAAGESYYITQIKFVDTVTIDTHPNLKQRVMWFDNYGLIGEDAVLQTTLESDAQYPVEVIRDVCELVGYTGYIEPGAERKDDVFVFEEIAASAGEVTAKQGINILGVSGITYKPTIGTGNNGICNRAFRKYYPPDDTEKRAAGTGYVNIDSMLRYGTWTDSEDMTNTTTQAEAEKDAKDTVNARSYSYIGFTLNMLGTVQLNPANFLISDVPHVLLSGNHEIKSMTNKLNLNKGEFRSSIDLNIPSKRFKSTLLRMKQELLGAKRARSEAMYSREGLGQLGFSGAGAFIQER